MVFDVDTRQCGAANVAYYHAVSDISIVIYQQCRTCVLRIHAGCGIRTLQTHVLFQLNSGLRRWNADIRRVFRTDRGLTCWRTVCVGRRCHRRSKVVNVGSHVGLSAFVSPQFAHIQHAIAVIAGLCGSRQTAPIQMIIYLDVTQCSIACVAQGNAVNH